MMITLNVVYHFELSDCLYKTLYLTDQLELKSSFLVILILQIDHILVMKGY